MDSDKIPDKYFHVFSSNKPTSKRYLGEDLENENEIIKRIFDDINDINFLNNKFNNALKRNIYRRKYLKVSITP